MNEQIAKFIRDFDVVNKDLCDISTSNQMPKTWKEMYKPFSEIGKKINGYLEEQSIEMVVTQYGGELQPIIRVLFETESYKADEYIGETPQIRGKRYAEIAYKIIDRQAQNE